MSVAAPRLRGDFERCVARGACERHVDSVPLDPADTDLPVTMVRANEPARRPPASRELATAMGESEGSIIAAIIVTHTTANHPRPPRSVPGPRSMPRIR